jgi:hypothetical protein
VDNFVHNTASDRGTLGVTATICVHAIQPGKLNAGFVTERTGWRMTNASGRRTIR